VIGEYCVGSYEIGGTDESYVVSNVDVVFYWAWECLEWTVAGNIVIIG
jgi:hypothetical protein